MSAGGGRFALADSAARAAEQRAAPHAAILTGKVGCLSRIGFFPFRILEEVPFPLGVELVVADSGEKAMKSTYNGVLELYNADPSDYQALIELLLLHSCKLNLLLVDSGTRLDISHLRLCQQFFRCRLRRFRRWWLVI